LEGVRCGVLLAEPLPLVLPFLRDMGGGACACKCVCAATWGECGFEVLDMMRSCAGGGGGAWLARELIGGPLRHASYRRVHGATELELELELERERERETRSSRRAPRPGRR
jgi:hypothetical protein